ncbi:hypothetical protein [Massilia niastensis]|uniref:hypothetical protein n=1 Tax=Massilia niastensis TaxID=544911 RepID=UPI0003667184|nr:hypothetical protein [Massilia niastensis]
MKPTTILMSSCLAALALLASGCDRGRTPAADGVLQTKFPGQVTSGGGSSGEVLARSARPTTDATYAGGTPGIAGGSGGTTGGAAMGGTVQESGQGPSSGTTQPASAGQAGTTLPSGDNKTPAAGPTPTAPASNASPQGPAAPSKETR